MMDVAHAVNNKVSLESFLGFSKLISPKLCNFYLNILYKRNNYLSLHLKECNKIFQLTLCEIIFPNRSGEATYRVLYFVDCGYRDMMK